MDLHAPQLQGFFDIPVDHLLGIPVLCKAIQKEAFMKNDIVVVSPDVGSVGRARQMAQKLNASLAIVDKRRPKANVMEVMNIVGDVRGKVCLMVDDMIDTAGTITQGARALVDVGGATEVYAPAIERLDNSVLKEIYVLNTIELPAEKKLAKIKEISVAPIFAEAIESIFADLPVSKLYD